MPAPIPASSPVLLIVTPLPTRAEVIVADVPVILLEVITPVTFRCWVVVTPITPSWVIVVIPFISTFPKTVKIDVEVLVPRPTFLNVWIPKLLLLKVPAIEVKLVPSPYVL